MGNPTLQSYLCGPGRRGRWVSVAAVLPLLAMSLAAGCGSGAPAASPPASAAPGTATWGENVATLELAYE